MEKGYQEKVTISKGKKSTEIVIKTYLGKHRGKPLWKSETKHILNAHK